MPREPKARTPFGQRLYDARKVLGLTQAELAKAVGIHTMTVTHLETSADENPTLEMIRRLAGALECQPSELLKGVPPILPEKVEKGE